MKLSLVLTLVGVLVTAFAASVALQLVGALGQLYWDAGREEGLIEALGVFGLGALLLLLVAAWAFVGAIWSRRTRRTAMWLSIVPGTLGFLVALAAALVFALNAGEEGPMAFIIPLVYGLGPLLIILAGKRARRHHRHTEEAHVAEGLHPGT